MEKDVKFQKEVTWCIEQLRMGMQTKNPSEKQVRECERVIKILTSNKASLVKKRQAMHQMFGDYRKKIEAAEKAWEKETIKRLQSMKISSKEDFGYHGKFLKSANSMSKKINGVADSGRQNEKNANDQSDSFCFNFDVEP